MDQGLLGTEDVDAETLHEIIAGTECHFPELTRLAGRYRWNWKLFERKNRRKDKDGSGQTFALYFVE